MSKVSEMVKAEADKAEADPTPEPEPTPEPTPEPEPEPGPEQTPEPTPEAQSMEAQAKAFDSEMRRHERALCKMLEVEPPLVPVPVEGAVGFMLPGVIEPKTNDDFRRCPTCNGHGRILTGSVRAGEEMADCPDPRCKGHGYWRKVEQAAPVQPVSTTVTAPAQQNGSADEWGEAAWMGDPTIRPQPTPIT